jgi:CrcB protein
MAPQSLLLVALGGAMGTSIRQLVAQLLPVSDGGWPAATFAVNVSGALLLGVLLEALARGGTEVGWRLRTRLFAGVGFCGALTTYRTLAVEVLLLVRGDQSGTAVAYAVASVVAGLLAAAAGVVVASAAHRRGDSPGPSRS